MAAAMLLTNNNNSSSEIIMSLLMIPQSKARYETYMTSNDSAYQLLQHHQANCHDHHYLIQITTLVVV